MTVEAEDEIVARAEAIQQFEPDREDLFSIDVFGLDPWRPVDDAEDRAYEQYRQEELDNEA